MIAGLLHVFVQQPLSYVYWRLSSSFLSLSRYAEETWFRYWVGDAPIRFLNKAEKATGLG